MHLFHYTDAHATQSILLNNKLWLTDLRFMNDSTELLHGMKFLNDALKQQPYGLFYDSNHSKSAIEYLTASLGEYEDSEHHEDPVFAMSFSEVDDLLSQWRGYGGYSIAFDWNCLEEHGLKLSRCVYDDSSKLGRALKHVSYAGAKVSERMGVNDGCVDAQAIEEATRLIELAATFKDSGFAEEREVRMTAHPDPRQIRFRPRKGILIPYVEIDIPAEAIVGVRIGPIRDQNLASISMRMFIDRVQKNHCANGGSIEWCVPTEKSMTPYRD